MCYFTIKQTLIIYNLQSEPFHFNVYTVLYLLSKKHAWHLPWKKQNAKNEHKQFFRSKMTAVYCYYKIWYCRKKCWWHKLNSNISFSFLMYWMYTLLLLLRSRFLDDITNCINESTLYAAADGKQMIPDFLLWWHGYWVICHKQFTTVNISEVEYCVISGI